MIWSPEARADLRGIDRETAMQILHCVDRYLANRTGDVKKLKPPFTGFRLRCGDYRVFFDQKDENTIDDHRRSQPPRGLPLNGSNNPRTNAERLAGQTPDKARMRTGHHALFGSVLFVAPKAQGMVS